MEFLSGPGLMIGLEPRSQNLHRKSGPSALALRFYAYPFLPHLPLMKSRDRADEVPCLSALVDAGIDHCMDHPGRVLLDPGASQDIGI